MRLNHLTPLEKKKRHREQIYKHRDEHRDEFLAYIREYHKVNKEKEVQYGKVYYQKRKAFKTELLALMNIQYL